MLLRLYNVSDSSACHSLTSFFTSGRADLGPRPTRPTFRSTYHEPQTSAGQALPAGSAWRAAETWLTSLMISFRSVLAAKQMLIEELDAAALVRALGLQQRILARPRPSEQPQGRDRSPTRLFLKPCLHAAEGLGGSHDSLEQLRRVFFDRACGTIRGFGGLFFFGLAEQPAPAPSAAALDLAHCVRSSALRPMLRRAISAISGLE